MFSEKLLAHFKDPRLAGDLAAPAVTVEVSNPACGDTLRLGARVEDGRIVEARFRVRGCAASIGTAAAMTEWLEGKPAAAFAATNAGHIEDLVDGLPAESKHAAVLCVDALRALAIALQAA